MSFRKFKLARAVDKLYDNEIAPRVGGEIINQEHLFNFLANRWEEIIDEAEVTFSSFEEEEEMLNNMVSMCERWMPEIVIVRHTTIVAAQRYENRSKSHLAFGMNLDENVCDEREVVEKQVRVKFSEYSISRWFLVSRQEEGPLKIKKQLTAKEAEKLSVIKYSSQDTVEHFGEDLPVLDEPFLLRHEMEEI